MARYRLDVPIEARTGRRFGATTIARGTEWIGRPAIAGTLRVNADDCKSYFRKCRGVQVTLGGRGAARANAMGVREGVNHSSM